MIATVLLCLLDITLSFSCSSVKDIIKFVVRDMQAPSPLKFTCILPSLSCNAFLRSSLT